MDNFDDEDTMTTKITSLEGLTRYDYVPGEAGRMIIGQEDKGSYVLFTDARALLASQAEPADRQKLLRAALAAAETWADAEAQHQRNIAAGGPGMAKKRDAKEAAGRVAIEALAAPPLSQPHQAVVAAGSLSGALNHAREALRFYAEGNHFMVADKDAWDTVSGEPQNFQCDEAGTATVEDGSVAKQALEDIALVERYASVAAPLPPAPAPVERAEPAGWLDPMSGSFYPSRKSVEKYAPFPDKVKPMYFDIATPSLPVGQALDLAALTDEDIIEMDCLRITREGDECAVATSSVIEFGRAIETHLRSAPVNPVSENGGAQ